MISENIVVTGKLHIILYDENGNIKIDKVVPNIVVYTGKKLITSRLSGNNTPVLSHMSVGTSKKIPESTDLALFSEIASSRTALVVLGGTVSNNEITFSATFGSGVGTGVITEAGVFNAFIDGSMLCRTTFAAVDKGSLETLSINWKVVIN